MNGPSLEKSSQAFRTIAEAATELTVAAHMLRYWEGKFNHIKPLKRAGGRRHYRPDDMALLRGIKALLYEDGYHIKGVQKLLRDNGVAWVRSRGDGLNSGALSQSQPDESAPDDHSKVRSQAALHANSSLLGPLFDAEESTQPIATMSNARSAALKRALAKLEAVRDMLLAVAKNPSTKPQQIRPTQK